MVEDKIQIYCGTGSGRSAAALGQGVRYACKGKSVFFVRFLKGKAILEDEYLKRLEPEIKLFSFDKFDGRYCDLSEEEKAEEQLHIRNGLGFAKKVLLTDECDVLILDEILDLVGMGIIDAADAAELMEAVGDNMILIMTGTHNCEQLWDKADRVTQVTTVREHTK